MIEMTASEASRSFSAVLDRTEGGETVVVTRGGRQVAVISPAPAFNGAAVRHLLERWQGRPFFDQAFADRMDAARTATAPGLDADAWAKPED